MNDFKYFEMFAIDIANCCLAKINTKHRIKNNILDVIALGCKLYSVDSDFKKQINERLFYRGLTDN